QTIFVRMEAALADLGALQRALIEHHLMQVLAPLLAQQIGMMRSLRIPDRVELALEKAALGIKAVALFFLVILAGDTGRPHAHPFPLGPLPVQKFAKGARPGRIELLAEP